MNLSVTKIFLRSLDSDECSWMLPESSSGSSDDRFSYTYINMSVLPPAN